MPIDFTRSLIARLRAGDANAGELLDQCYRAAMLRFCARYLGDRQAAEDVVQEVFRKVLQTTEVPSNFRAWLYQIARNHCLSVRRTRVRRPEQRLESSDDSPPAELTGPLSRLARREDQSRLLHLVAALPEAHREVLRLRYTEGLSRAETAFVLSIPEPLVKSRLYEALQKLREHRSLMDN